jgi:hypothetical protein
VTSLATERRGSTYVEFLIVIVPFTMFVLCVLQTALLEFADLVVERSANAAARSAAVVLDDDPRFYQGEARNTMTAGGARERVIRQGAANTLTALKRAGREDSPSQLQVMFPAEPGADRVRSSFDPAELVTVRVAYRFRCGIPLARRIMCHDGSGGAQAEGDSFMVIQAEASLPNQGARYAYGGGR